MAVTPVKRFFLRRSLERAYSPDPVPRDYEHAAMALWQRGPHQTAVFLQELTDAWAQFRTLAPHYPTITVPVVIVTGECDSVVHPHAFSRQVSSFDRIPSQYGQESSPYRTGQRRCPAHADRTHLILHSRRT